MPVFTSPEDYEGLAFIEGMQRFDWDDDTVVQAFQETVQGGDVLNLCARDFNNHFGVT